MSELKTTFESGIEFDGGGDNWQCLSFGAELGEIWRPEGEAFFIFEPLSDSVFSYAQLRDIAAFLDQLNKEEK